MMKPVSQNQSVKMASTTCAYSDETHLESAERALAVATARALNNQSRQLRELLTRVKSEAEARMNNLTIQIRRVDLKQKKSIEELSKLRAPTDLSEHQHTIYPDDMASSSAS